MCRLQGNLDLYIFFLRSVISYNLLENAFKAKLSIITNNDASK